MRMEYAKSCPVSIFMAGDVDEARRFCGGYCDMRGLCVTVTPTTYVYTGGQENGFVVGLINYPRFPSEPTQLETIAIDLGKFLRKNLGQESFSVQTPTRTTWFSWREQDIAIADRSGNRRDGETRLGPKGESIGAEGNRP